MEAFFLTVSQQRRFCLLHSPQDPDKLHAAALYLHPFAEELNRSRRIAALAARQLADSGVAVLQLDLFGCGDSDGEFAEATWAQWLEDAATGLDWLSRRFNVPKWLWGVRMGALLALDLANRRGDISGLLLWQPQLSGKQALRQFLRIKTAEQMLEGARGASALPVGEQLSNGQSVEIAGYWLSPTLTAGIEAVEATPSPAPLRIECIEITGSSESKLSPATVKFGEQWALHGHSVRPKTIVDTQFWQMADPGDAPVLLEATVASMTR